MLAEKYRVQSLSGILGHKKIIEILKGYIEKHEMPNCLFVGKPGTGKTAISHGLAADMGCKPTGFLELNASSERGIDTIRDIVKAFARTKAITQVGFKICLYLISG